MPANAIDLYARGFGQQNSSRGGVDRDARLIASLLNSNSRQRFSEDVALYRDEQQREHAAEVLGALRNKQLDERALAAADATIQQKQLDRFLGGQTSASQRKLAESRVKDVNERLDKFIAENPNLPQEAVQDLELQRLNFERSALRGTEALPPRLDIRYAEEQDSVLKLARRAEALKQDPNYFEGAEGYLSIDKDGNVDYSQYLDVVKMRRERADEILQAKHTRELDDIKTRLKTLTPPDPEDTEEYPLGKNDPNYREDLHDYRARERLIRDRWRRLDEETIGTESNPETTPPTSPTPAVNIPAPDGTTASFISTAEEYRKMLASGDLYPGKYITDDSGQLYQIDKDGVPQKAQ